MHAVNVFVCMLTQWRRAGMSGVPCGLDYSVLPEIWLRAGVPEDARTDAFDDLRVLEDAALEHFAREREQKG